MMLTHCGNNVRNRYSGCVFSVKDIVPVPLKTSRNHVVPRRFQWYIAEGMFSLPATKYSMVIRFSVVR